MKLSIKYVRHLITICNTNFLTKLKVTPAVHGMTTREQQSIKEIQSGGYTVIKMTGAEFVSMVRSTKHMDLPAACRRKENNLYRVLFVFFEKHPSSKCFQSISCYFLFCYFKYEVNTNIYALFNKFQIH